MVIPSRTAAPELEADLARAEIERDAAEGLEHVGAEQQRRLVRQPEQLERRHVGEGDRHVVQEHRAELELVDAARVAA